MTPRQWPNWANGVLGVWMFASPWILALGGGTASRTAWFLGAAIVIFAGLAAYLPKAWEEVINILLGIYVPASPEADSRRLAETLLVSQLAAFRRTGALIIEGRWP